MSIYHVSGLPAVGKTSVEQRLIALGYDTINTDEKWGYHGIIDTEQPIDRPDNPAQEWFDTHGFIWDTASAHKELSAYAIDKALFICGGSRNESKLYDMFSKIFILHIPDELRESRLIARNEPHTNNPLFFERMRVYNAQTYEHASIIGAIVIESDYGVDAALKEILSYINERPNVV